MSVHFHSIAFKGLDVGNRYDCQYYWRYLSCKVARRLLKQAPPAFEAPGKTCPPNEELTATWRLYRTVVQLSASRRRMVFFSYPNSGP